MVTPPKSRSGSPTNPPAGFPRVTVFGIRHHGPGSARSLVAALEGLQPDAVLVEGPPDADDLIELVADEEMVPPVALLVYRPDEPTRAVYYPFAEFSPEWQALRWAVTRRVPARFMDLPMAHRFAVRLGRPRGEDVDPIGVLGEAAGYSDPERWWEQIVEERRDPTGVFEAILEAMTAVRATADASDAEESLREAWMRKTIRAASAPAPRTSPWSAAPGTPRRCASAHRRRTTTRGCASCPRSRSRPPGCPGPTAGSPTPRATAPASSRPAGTTTSGACATPPPPPG